MHRTIVPYTISYFSVTHTHFSALSLEHNNTSQHTPTRGAASDQHQHQHHFLRPCGQLDVALRGRELGKLLRGRSPPAQPSPSATASSVRSLAYLAPPWPPPAQPSPSATASLAIALRSGERGQLFHSIRQLNRPLPRRWSRPNPHTSLPSLLDRSRQAPSRTTT